jgi:hypothetical protein
MVEALMVGDEMRLKWGRKMVATLGNDGLVKMKTIRKGVERIHPQDQPAPEVGTTEHVDRYGMPVTGMHRVDNPDHISDMQWRRAEKTCKSVTKLLEEIQKLVDGRLVDGKIIHCSGKSDKYTLLSKEQFMSVLHKHYTKLYGTNTLLSKEQFTRFLHKHDTEMHCQFNLIDELFQMYNQLQQAKKETQNRKKKEKQESQQHREQQRQRQPEKKKIATNKSRKKERRNAKVRGRKGHEDMEYLRNNFMHTHQQVKQADTAQRDRKDEEQQEQPKKKNNNKKRKRGKGNVASAHQRQYAKRVQKREYKCEDIVQPKGEEVAQLKAENKNLNYDLMCVRPDKLCPKSQLDRANFKKQKLKSELEEKNYEIDGLGKSNEDLNYANHDLTNDLWRANDESKGWRRERAAWSRFGISMTDQLIQARNQQRTEDEKAQRRWDGVEN